MIPSRIEPTVIAGRPSRARGDFIIRASTRFLIAVYFVWSGLWLLLAPWTALWDHNWFARLLPILGTAMENRFVRGAVSGIGLVTIGAGVRELFGVFGARDDVSQSTSPR